VNTDAGLEGLGAVYSHPDLARIIIEGHFKPFLLGRDPTEVEDLWEQMYKLSKWYGRKGVAISAIGGLDIAFWDIKGKVAKLPVYELLGGSSNSVPAYGSGLFWVENVEVLESEAASYVARGFKRIKMRVGRSYKYDVAALEAVRRGVGEDVEILVDGSQRFTEETATKITPVLKELGVGWFEEPFPAEDIEAYAKFRPQATVPLAAGEHDFAMEGFRDLLRWKAVDIIQPDVSRAGGITECLRIGKMSEENGTSVATHTWSDAVTVIANAHVVAALRNGMTVEIDQTNNLLISDLLTAPLCVKDGWLAVPKGPGLGIEVNSDLVDQLRLLRGQHVPDGHYSDMIFGRQYFTTPPPYR
jgi:D-galactarolactone cycloisomerase